MNETNILLNKAINNNELDDWVQYKHFRYSTQKNVNNAKKQHLINKINNSYNKYEDGKK